MILSGDTIISLNWKVKTTTQLLWAPHDSKSTKKGFMELAGVTDPDYKGGNWTAPPQRYVWNTGDSIRYLLVIS